MHPLVIATKYLGKNVLKNGTLDALDSRGITPLNNREKYAIDRYTNPDSPLYQNKEMIKEYYNPNLPIDKEIKDWNATDLVNATNSPLYKYDPQLQNKAREYIKYREKRRFNLF